jgi:hypothetical protein
VPGVPGTGDGSGGQVNNGGGDPAVNVDAQGAITNVAAYRQPDLAGALAPVVVLELIALVALPPVVYYLWIRRRKGAA